MNEQPVDPQARFAAVPPLAAPDGPPLPAGHAGRPGLRERKKRQTYETIARVALDLFHAQGFRATTIAQIADAADVSPRTVSAYYPAKEDLVFPHSSEAIDGLALRLSERRPGEYAVDALRSWIGELFDEMGDKHEHERERVRRVVIEGDETLRAYERRQMERAERLLGDAIADDLGTGPDDVAAQLASAAAIGAMSAIGRIHDEQGEFADPVAHRDAALALVDQAIVFLRGGVSELRAHRGEPPLR